MVADLNPDQTPSLLNNPPDLEMSSEVMHSLRHSSLGLYSSNQSRHIQTTRSSFFQISTSYFIVGAAYLCHGERVSVLYGSLRLQSVSLFTHASKGKRTTSAVHIDLFSPGYSV